MAARKVAIVTGANRGIGYSIVKALTTPGPTLFDGDVILTARDEAKGKKAVESLKAEGNHALFHPLDVSSMLSIDALKDSLTKNYTGLDLLVNNAGIYSAPLPSSKQPSAADCENMIKVNYFGVANTSFMLFPLLRPHARVVHMSASYGLKSLKDCKGKVKEELAAGNLTMDRLSQLMLEYVKCGKEGKLAEAGWSNHPYGVAKGGLLWLTVLQQQEVDKLNKDIAVNCVCPGWVATDMGGPKAPLTPDQGADTPVYLSLLPPNVDSPKGNFVIKRKVMKFPPK